jgi:hypothetical protein
MKVTQKQLSDNIIRAARQYREHGLHVVTPKVGGVTKEIRVALGASGVVALVADPSRGGKESYLRLKKDSSLPKTPTYVSPKGGLRYFLFKCGSAEITKVQLDEGLVLHGGLTELPLPPSKNGSGAALKWKDQRALGDTEVAELPAEVLTKVVGVSPSTGSQVPEPFDPARFRLSQDFLSEMGVTKLNVPPTVGRPGNLAWVRVHPDAEWQAQFALLEQQGGRTETPYLLSPAVVSLLPGVAKPRVLYTAVDSHGTVYLWPVGVPNPDRPNTWTDSAHDAADLAKERWVRVTSNMGARRYDIHTCEVERPEPVWPDGSFDDLLRRAFDNRQITSADHPVVQRLLGKAL